MKTNTQIERLFCAEVFNVYRRQLKLLEHVGTNSWSFDLDSHTFSITGGESWGAQIIGVETGNIWKWSWDNSDDRYPDSGVALANVLKKWGLETNMEEFTVAKIPCSQLVCGGHTLALISAAQTPCHPYFAMPQEDDDTLFIVVNDFEYPGKLDPLSGEEFGGVFAKLINDFQIPDESLALTSALDLEGYSITRGTSLITGVRADGSIEAEIDSENRLLAFNVR